MIVYQETKEQFLLDVYNDKIDEKIEKLATKALPANVKNIGTTKD